jgi:lipopolysaccharide export system protein LptA
MKPVIRRSALFGLTVFALAIGGAQAQIQGEGPVAVTSNDFTFEGNVAVYKGAVEAVQGQTRLRCSVLRVYFQPRQGASSGALSGGGNAERYDCSGPVYYVTPTEQAKSDAGIFTVASNTIVLTGNVTVQQGQNVAQGDKLTINTRTKATQLESSGSKRVRTVIYPDQPAAPGRPGGE